MKRKMAISLYGAHRALTVKTLIEESGIINDKTKIAIRDADNYYLLANGKWHEDCISNCYDMQIESFEWSEMNTCEIWAYDGSQYENKNDKEEEPKHYTPSCESGDYSPSHPWDAPGMSVSDFI